MKLQTTPGRLLWRLLAFWCPVLIVLAPMAFVPLEWRRWWFLMLVVIGLMVWGAFLAFQFGWRKRTVDEAHALLVNRLVRAATGRRNGDDL